MTNTLINVDEKPPIYVYKGCRADSIDSRWSKLIFKYKIEILREEGRRGNNMSRRLAISNFLDDCQRHNIVICNKLHNETFMPIEDESYCKSFLVQAINNRFKGKRGKIALQELRQQMEREKLKGLSVQGSDKDISAADASIPKKPFNQNQATTNHADAADIDTAKVIVALSKFGRRP